MLELARQDIQSGEQWVAELGPRLRTAAALGESGCVSMQVQMPPAMARQVAQRMDRLTAAEAQSLAAAQALGEAQAQYLIAERRLRDFEAALRVSRVLCILICGVVAVGFLIVLP